MMRKIPKDSTLASKYLERVTEAIRKVAPAMAQLENLALKLGVYQNQLSELIIESSDDLDEIEFVLERFDNNIFSSEVPYIFQPYPESKTLRNVFSLSYEKAYFTFQIYFKRSWYSRIWIDIIFILIFLANRWTISELDRHDNHGALGLTKRWVSFPVLSSAFVALGFGQFFYIDAPAVFIQYIWFIMLVVGTIIFYRDYERKVIQCWLGAMALILFSFAVNLTVQISQTERWLMMGMAVAGLVLAWLYYNRVVKIHSVEMPFISGLLVLFASQELTGMVANFFGRYTLSRIMITGGYFNFINGIVLWWMLLLLTELMYLVFETLSKKESFTPYFDFIRYKEATRPLLVKVVVLLWFLLFLKTINFYDTIVRVFRAILTQVRTIGDYTFTLRGILIFIFVLFVSSLIARPITFLLSPSKSGDQPVAKKS